MKFFSLASAAFILTLAMGASAAPAPAQPSPFYFADPFESLRLQDQRVAAVSFALRRAIRDSCSSRTLDLGWTLHNARQYAPKVRQRAQDHFRLRGGLPSVLAIAARGPAARGGLLIDDVVVAINGKPIEAAAPYGPADPAPLKRQIAMIDAALGEVALVDVLREGAEVRVRIDPERICAFRSSVEPSAELQANSNADDVSITSGMARFARTDDELAFLLAHEYAHIILGHNAAGNIDASGARSIGFEFDADRLALSLTQRSGYRIDGVVALFERLGRARPLLEILPSGHPTLGRRRAALRAEIERLGKSGSRTPGRS